MNVFWLLVIACAVILRSSRSPGLKGWLAVGGSFALLLALLQVVTGAAAPAGRGLVALWTLIAQGYQLVTVSELLGETIPGGVYYMK